MNTSSIEWTEATWNPVTGCTKVSPGCDHCYAETFAERWRGVAGHAYEHGFDLTLRPRRLGQPFGWKKPSRVFVNSMSDLFHVDVPATYIEQVWDVMARTQRHTYQVLTKRAERMERVVDQLHSHFDDYLERYVSSPLPNVWLGVSVESPTYYSRIRHLQRTPAAVRFLSCEPLLARLPDLPLTGIDWVIVGGESGHEARPMHPDWVRDIRDQCQRAGVAFFFKQWGHWTPEAPPHWVPGGAVQVLRDGSEAQRPHALLFALQRHTGQQVPPPVEEPVTMYRVGKKAAGRVLDGRTWDEMPA